ASHELAVLGRRVIAQVARPGGVAHAGAGREMVLDQHRHTLKRPVSRAVLRGLAGLLVGPLDQKAERAVRLLGARDRRVREPVRCHLGGSDEISLGEAVEQAEVSHEPCLPGLTAVVLSNASTTAAATASVRAVPPRSGVRYSGPSVRTCSIAPRTSAAASLWP